MRTVKGMSETMTVGVGSKFWMVAEEDDAYITAIHPRHPVFGLAIEFTSSQGRFFLTDVEVAKAIDAGHLKPVAGPGAMVRLRAVRSIYVPRLVPAPRVRHTL